ncbi:MAG: phenylalanine--tRNA ligase subunit alpha, partial [Defluviitaleaceae bacterium]|nr:phenylalanine--tRNA ligase subunit alpha [Defluviitaleaceae bacterium]
QQVAESLKQENIDVTLPGRRRPLGHLHPLTIVIDEIKDLFIGLGFTIADGPEVEADYYCFEALNIPANHPVRDVQDTFYTEGDFVLRTQTSGVQVRVMENAKPPIRIIAPGRVYRSEDWDATHAPVFHQIEGLVVDEDITMADLKGILTLFAQRILGEDIQIRFRPSFFPFTEPSAEMDVQCFVCGGNTDDKAADESCHVCKGTGWVELLGCGMVHPQVLANCGIDPTRYSGYAFGMGYDRITMQRFKINDIRMFYENDMQFLQQF